ncbi:unnamed protein product [Durusdinium trenchii]|uniref:Uncharacterized protein n=1 Tax=Durusdinium trenchii TaxID=1381693 RepID=A0ABP0KSW7_9DINO
MRLSRFAQAPPSAEDIRRLKNFFAKATVATNLLKSRLALPIAYPLNAAMMREDNKNAPLRPSEHMKDKVNALNSDEWKLRQQGLAQVMPIVEGMSKVATVLKAAQALTYYQGGAKRHVMPDPKMDKSKCDQDNDIRIHQMRPTRVKAAYGRGPGWIVTKTGMGHGWDDVGTGRVADSRLNRVTVDPFDDTPHFSTQQGKKFVSKTKWNPRKSGSQ